VEEAELAKLEQQIRQHGFCAVIEVTNGISRKGIQAKVDQARRGRDFIEGLVKGAVPVQTGLVFYRNRNVLEIEGEGIDFIAQIQEYDRQLAAEALRQIQTHDHVYDHDRAIAQAFLQLLQEGRDLEETLYPTKETWQKFKQRHPQLTAGLPDKDQRKGYHDKISKVKGLLLPEYTARAIERNLREAIVRRELQYSHRGEIDIAVIGPQDWVIAAATHSKYFIHHAKEPAEK
jgi:hypothetical protein